MFWNLGGKFYKHGTVKKVMRKEEPTVADTVLGGGAKSLER